MYKSLPVPHVGGSFTGQVPQDEEKQLVVVSLVGQVSGKVLLHGLHDGVLLRVDEGLQHHSHGHVDVILGHELSQVHLGVTLGDPDHALDVPKMH